MALWSSGLYYVIVPEEIGRRSCFLTFNAVLEQKQIACHQLVCFKTLHPDFCCSERFHYFSCKAAVWDATQPCVHTESYFTCTKPSDSLFFSSHRVSAALPSTLLLIILLYFVFAVTVFVLPCMYVSSSAMHGKWSEKKSLSLTICCPHRCSITVIGQHVKVLHQQNTREGIQLYISMMSSVLPHFWRIHSCGSKLIQIISV